MFSELLADAPFHFTLVLASICGYFAVKWVTRHFYPEGKQALAAKLKACELKLQAEAQVASPKPRKIAKTQRALKAKVVPAAPSAEQGTGQEPIAAFPAPMPAAQQALAPPEMAAEPTKLHPMPAPATSAPVSDRVVRLLAKKAERKSRKAQECWHKEEVCALPSTLEDAAATACAAGKDQCELACAATLLAPKQPEACFDMADTGALGMHASTSEQDDSEPPRTADLPPQQEPAAEVEHRHSVDTGARVADSSTSDEEHSELAFDTTFSPQKLADSDAAIAELSTGDEALMCAGPAEETGDEFFWGDMKVDAYAEQLCQPLCMQPHQQVGRSQGDEFFLEDMRVDTREYGDTFPAEELGQLLYTQQFQHTGRFQASFPCSDPWLAPFDEIIRSPDEAKQVYEQVYQDMCSCAEAALVPEGQYQPVLCENAQKLYTDGQQLYMLACIDVPEDADMSVPRIMRPVFDACDPLHEQFAADLQKGLMPNPAQEKPIWDVCWD